LITYDGKYYKLPTMAPNSDCMYILATDPRMMHFTLMARGNSLVLGMLGIYEIYKQNVVEK